MLIPLGFLAASGVSGGAFDLLESTVLTGTQASVQFTNLTTKYAASYQHLQLRTTSRTNVGTNFGEWFLTLNGDTANNYAHHQLRVSGTALASEASTSRANMPFGQVPGSGGGSPANVFGAQVVDIIDPFETKNKTLRSFGGRVFSGNEWIGLHSGLWMNTASVTSITLTANGSFVSGTRFSLYGIRSVA
jgi:hypothetical protein